MGFAVETITVECCYQDMPYVGRGLERRYIIIDDETFEVLVDGEKGKGYPSYKSAILAYFRYRYGTSGRKRQNAEHLRLYEWALNNQNFLQRFDRIAALYLKDGYPLDAAIVKKIFIRTNTMCPTTPSKFFKAYQNKFYEDEIIRRKKREEQFERIKSTTRLKLGMTDGLKSNDKLLGLTFANNKSRKIDKFIDKYKKSSIGQLLNPRAKFNLDEPGQLNYILEDDTTNLTALGIIDEDEYEPSSSKRVVTEPSQYDDEKMIFDISSSVEKIMAGRKESEADTIIRTISPIEEKTSENEFIVPGHEFSIEPEDVEEYKAYQKKSQQQSNKRYNGMPPNNFSVSSNEEMLNYDDNFIANTGFEIDDDLAIELEMPSIDLNTNEIQERKDNRCCELQTYKEESLKSNKGKQAREKKAKISMKILGKEIRLGN